MQAAAMQSMSAGRAIPAPEKPKEPSPEWHIVQGVLCQSMNTLGDLVGFAFIIDGLISSLLETRLAAALMRPWDDSAAQWPLVHLIEAGRQELLEPDGAEWYFYEHGKEKAVAALYQATIDDKFFFDDFDKLLHHSKVSLIGRTLRKVAPYWDPWVKEYDEPKGIKISYFKISRRRKTAKNPAPQKPPPTTHSAVPTSKRRRSKSPNEEENTLPGKSDTLALFRLQPPTASVPEDTQCNSQTGPPSPSNYASINIHTLAQQHPQPRDTQWNYQTGPPPPSNDASRSTHIHTLAPQQHPQQFTKTNIFNTGQGEYLANMLQAGSRVTDFQFDDTDFNLDLEVMHSERVTDFNFENLDVNFDDVNVGDTQHPTTVTGFRFDLDDSRQRQSKADDLRFDNPGDSCLPFGNLHVGSLHHIPDFHIEGPGGDTYPALLPFPAQDAVGGTQRLLGQRPGRSSGSEVLAGHP